MDWTWIPWGLMLVVQNAAFTLVSRARNSNSLLYHGLASLLSNGVWFASQLILVNEFLAIFKSGDWTRAAVAAVFYTVCTMTGSIGMHWLALHKLERVGGSR